ncbi:Metacaspase-1 [Forsythia ovata]|uniref:Metacaspase-1 n=1 Tax=Forsythia ovata TaxID=205694 RepID=A0ABD1QMK5_9LAMI
MEMAGKRVRCSCCGVQLMVPPNTYTVQCARCLTVIRFQPRNHLGQAHDSIRHTASRMKDLLNTVSSNINTMVPSVNSYPSSMASGNAHHSQPVAPSLPVSAHQRKRAVLCGVSYFGNKYRLNGTVNDVKCMRYFLIQKLGFPSDSILLLSEEESDPCLIPTKQNIRRALRWLVQGCQSGDSLVFHFSGHGSQQLDFNGDEVDGYDETLWPVDHETEGKISDDEINATIVRPLPQGTKLHAIIDACHSGTVLDLQFVCRMNREGYYLWEDHGSQSAIYKGTNGGLAVSISACDDNQVSEDTTALSGNTATGAMTYCFIQAVQNEPGLTYGRLLNAMRKKIRDTKTGILLNGPIASLAKKVLFPKSSQVCFQEPQLSSSEKFDIYSTPFAL